VAEEVAPTTGTPHLQGYLSFRTLKTVKQVAKHIPGAHIEIAKGDSASNRAYCVKTGGPLVETGKIPVTAAQKGANEKLRWQTIIAHAADNEWLLENEPKVLLHQQNLLTSIVNRLAPPVISLSWLDNHWWYGPTGTGKSKDAFDMYPKAYRKDPQSRWWDGYTNQDVVIIDDFDKYQLAQCGDMKRWLDHYPFLAPIKGSYKLIRPKTIIVTSNYHPLEIWTDPQSYDPILRRVATKWYGEGSEPNPRPAIAHSFNLFTPKAPYAHTCLDKYEEEKGIFEM
jgi:hypothetical protein